MRIHVDPVPQAGPGMRRGRNALSGSLDGTGLGTLLAHARNKGNSLVLFEGAVTFAHDFRVMCEKILAAGFRADEAETLLIVEPLDDTEFSLSAHLKLLLMCERNARAGHQAYKRHSSALDAVLT